MVYLKDMETSVTTSSKSASLTESPLKDITSYKKINKNNFIHTLKVFLIDSTIPP